MDIVKLLSYMENLRYDRKMSQEIYLQDVISQRQYYRYRNGESEVPFDVIIKFANKLQIPLLKLITSFQSHSEKEKEAIKEYLNLVVNKRLVEAKNFISKFRNLLLIDEETKMFYNLSKLLFEFYSSKISSNELIGEIKRKIDFESVMKKEVLHDSELYIFGVIMEYSEEDREVIFRKINNLRKKDKLLLGGNVLFNSQLYFWIIKSLGRMNKYKQLIEIAEDAITYAQNNYSYYSTEYFHYYKALAYYKLGNKDDFEIELSKTMFVLLQLEKHKRSRFLQTIQKDTDVDCKEFLISRIEEEFQ